jgi:hypothetical protein
MALCVRPAHQVARLFCCPLQAGRQADRSLSSSYRQGETYRHPLGIKKRGSPRDREIRCSSDINEGRPWSDQVCGAGQWRAVIE